MIIFAIFLVQSSFLQTFSKKPIFGTLFSKKSIFGTLFSKKSIFAIFFLKRSLHLILTPGSLLHRRTELRILILPLHLIIDLLHKLGPRSTPVLPGALVLPGASAILPGVPLATLHHPRHHRGFAIHHPRHHRGFATLHHRCRHHRGFATLHRRGRCRHHCGCGHRRHSRHSRHIYNNTCEK